ncbi:MAG: type I DNA topoisomerase [Oscillospiraceae bacterium]|nr:type I DNA topoisomerase [Oscillospiraceae bacterium]
MAKALVIVESPAKAKTIEKYLGTGYKVTASWGHLRDLPKSKLGVDIEGGFVPEYKPIKGKEEIIENLKKDAAKSSMVYLATDPDREGEAISWHLKEILELPEKKTLRVTFNEITKKVVCESITNPRSIDQNLVDAQQARRVLDRIVGYKLSPLLWSKIKRGLSAGRVQSAVTRMVVDRENEIRAFTPEEYWLLDAVLKCADGGSITAHFYGSGNKKTELHCAEDVEKVISAVSHSDFVISELKRADKQRSPSAPFITSSLQQEASRRLNMTPRRTMSVAQQLYEGIEISGEGSVGLITYMRTDSLRVSEEASSAARNFIIDNYGREYYPPRARSFKTAKGAQDAHEAIRPSNVYLVPEKIKGDLSSEQYRLYKLIWSRFMASQMAAAVYDSVSADIVSAGYVFKFSNSVMKFAGFTKVYDNGSAEEESASELPQLEEGYKLELDKLVKEQKYTQPPARYTEDTLIGAMKEKGIGRPSTYAPTVSTIMDREYVVKEGKNLRPTNLGEVVTEFMCERFSDIANPTFTARMEENLDEIEEGKRNWKDVLGDFYGSFEKTLDKAVKDTEGVRIRIPPEVSDEICPNCGKNLVVKTGRFGRFLACPDYPNCTFTMPLVIEMPGKCPKCGGRILKRTSKKGYAYYACEKGAECGFMTWDVPTKDNCPECGHTMFKKSGKGYKRPFCINESCSRFVPEENRGYRKKTAEEGAGGKKKKEEAGK